VGTYCIQSPLELKERESVIGERFTIALYAPRLVTESLQRSDRKPRNLPDVVEDVRQQDGLGDSRRYLDIRDLYLRSHLDIHIHWAVRPEWDADVQNICGVIKRAPRQGATRQRSGGVQFGVNGADRMRWHSDGEQFPVLINHVDPMQVPQRLKAWPSLVGLQPVNRCLESSLSQLSDLVRPSVPECDPCGVDGELARLVWGAMLHHQAPEQVIERAAEVVDTVAQEGWPVRWRALGFLYAIESLRILQIIFTPNSVRLAGGEGPDLGVQLVEMGFRPAELLTATVKRVRHG
jgi:hypothetical protein